MADATLAYPIMSRWAVAQSKDSEVSGGKEKETFWFTFLESKDYGHTGLGNLQTILSFEDFVYH